MVMWLCFLAASMPPRERETRFPFPAVCSPFLCFCSSSPLPTATRLEYFKFARLPRVRAPHEAPPRWPHKSSPSSLSKRMCIAQPESLSPPLPPPLFRSPPTITVYPLRFRASARCLRKQNKHGRVPVNDDSMSYVVSCRTKIAVRLPTYHYV